MKQKRLLFKFIFPTILTNICYFLYTIIDGIFIGNGVSTNALGAINIVYPFLLIVYGFNIVVAVGGSTIVAIRIGRGDKAGANQAFMNSVAFGGIIAILITFISCIFTVPIGRLLGANDTYIGLVRDYLFWYSIFTASETFSVIFQFFCRNDGAPGLIFYASITGAVTNIILDWLFIFIFHFGLTGAAVATGIGHSVCCLICLSHFLFKKSGLRFKRFRFDFSLIKKISFRGFPEMVAQYSIPVTTYCMNHVLLTNYGDVGINAYAIINYVASFALSFLYGVSEGLQPLLGQSYGAENLKSLKFFFRSGIFIAFIGSTLCILGTNFYSKEIAQLFGANLGLADIISQDLPKYSWGFIFAGMNALISAYFYSTKRSGAAIFYNMMRCIILNAFCILFLPVMFGQNIIWYTYGISEVLVSVLGMIMIKVSERNGIAFSID